MGCRVAPRAGAGIEIGPDVRRGKRPPVAPRAGAGIEMQKQLPIWNKLYVAPRAGAGIEIILLLILRKALEVAPRAGAGIEIICGKHQMRNRLLSPLAQGRELKLQSARYKSLLFFVAPRAGAGIEISLYKAVFFFSARRPSRRGGN